MFVKGPQPPLTKRHIELVPLAKAMTKTNRPMPRYGTSTLIREHEVVFFSEGMASKPLLESRVSVPGLYRFRVSANAVNHGKSMTLLVIAGNLGFGVQGLMTHPVAMFDVADTPTVVEFTTTLDARESIRFLPQGLPNVYTPVTEGYSGPGLAMQWVEVEGPIIDTWPPAATQRLLGKVDPATGTAADAEEILRRLLPSCVPPPRRRCRAGSVLRTGSVAPRPGVHLRGGAPRRIERGALQPRLPLSSRPRRAS